MDILERWRLSIIERHARGRVLDVGCGYNNLIRRRRSGVGVDVHPWPGLDVQCDANALPFSDATFDTVVIAAALNHFASRDAALREANRVLRPGGRLLVTMIGPWTGVLAHVFFHHDEDVRGGFGRHELKGMSSDSVRSLLEQGGFSLHARHHFQLGLNTLFVARKAAGAPPRRNTKLSIIIPVYNEQSTLAEVIDRVCSVDLPGIEKEIIIADDGSRDETPNIIASKNREHPHLIKVHTSLINLGKGAAVRFGLEFASGDIVLIQDADLELVPEEYPDLLAPILSGEADVVYGTRFRGRSNRIPRHTIVANRLLTSLTNVLYGSELSDMATAYKVFRRELLGSMRLRSTGFEFEPEFTAKLLLSGYQIVEVPISYNPRSTQEGKKVSWRDGVRYVITLLQHRFSR